MDNHLADETLLGLIARKNPQALETLYERHAQVTYNLIARIVRDTAIADELLQETFWQVWQKAGEFSGRGAAAAWLYRIARNKSLDALRRQKARPQPMQTDSPEAEDRLWAQLPAVEPPPEQVTGERQLRDQLHDGLRQIPLEQRHCLELAYFHGLTQQQIADRLEVPLGTVKTRLRLGLQKLERIFRGAGEADIEL